MKRLFFIALIFLSSCTSLDKVVSTTEKNIVTNEYAYTDTDSQIRYSVSNDEKNLHIRLNSTDMTTISKIFKTGLKICFDVKGKKNKSVYFEYPLSLATQPLKTGTTMLGTAAAMKSKPVDPMEVIPTEGEFNRNGVKERILVQSKTSDIQASIRTINMKEFVYDLIIPLKRISQEGIPTLAKLSLGIVSGTTVETSVDDYMGGGPGGGPPPGGGMDFGGGPPPGGFGMMPLSNSPIDIWFKVNLQKIN